MSLDVEILRIGEMQLQSCEQNCFQDSDSHNDFDQGNKCYMNVVIMLSEKEKLFFLAQYMQ